MPALTFKGSRAELDAALASIPRKLAGKEPDATGAVVGLLRKMGAVLLGKIHEAALLKSAGGTDAMGVSWPALSGATLALRSVQTGARQMAKAKEKYRRLPDWARSLVREHAKRAAAAIVGEEKASRKHALKILEAQKKDGKVGGLRYRRMKQRLEQGLPAAQLRREAFMVSFAAILRRSGRLLAGLVPGSSESVIRVDNGRVTVGSSVPYQNFHDSKKPRRQKRGGGDRLPRRQIFPDDPGQLPDEWKSALRKTLLDGIRSGEFLRQLLGGKVS